MKACGPGQLAYDGHDWTDPFASKPVLPDKPKREEAYLKPLTSKPKTLGIFALDIESKRDDSQDAGFTRPFKVGFFDGSEYTSFSDSGRMAFRLPWQEWHLREGGCIDAFCKFLFSGGGEDRKRFQSLNGFCYGHNAGKFDFLFILGWLLRHRDEYVFEIASVMSKIQRLDVWVKGTDPDTAGKWVFADSVSLLPMSLDKVGDTFCRNVFLDDTLDEDGNKVRLGKRKMSLDLPEWDPLWDIYLKDDCRVLWYGVTAYQTMISKLGGEVGITSPATAMKTFRRSFQKDWIYIGKHFPGCDGKCPDEDLCERGTGCDGKCHGCLHKWIRLGYYGGRVEPHRKFGTYILCYDINSSYPASMRSPMPIGKPTVYGPMKFADMARLRKTQVGFVECTVEIPKNCKLPPLPWRVPEGRRITVTQPDGTETVVPPGKLVFPTGRISGVWDYDELCLLMHPLVDGKIVEVKKSVWYQQKPIFVDFVDTLYKFRDKNDPSNYERGVIERDGKGGILNEDEFGAALAEVCKLMMNALYGKFGMRPERTGLLLVDVEAGPSAWPENAEPLWRSPTDVPEDCLVWEEDRYVEAPYIIPQVSAHITALSRIRLFMGAADVLAQGGTLYYMDTDSIRTSVAIPDSLMLGGWKLENPKDVILESTFVLPKLYQDIAHKASCEYIQSFIPESEPEEWKKAGRHNTAWKGARCPGCAFVFHHPECKKKFPDRISLATFLREHCQGDVIIRTKEGRAYTGHGRVFSINSKDGTVACKGCSAYKHKMKGISHRDQTIENWERLLRRDQEDPVRGERLAGHKQMLRRSGNLKVIDLQNLLKEKGFDGKEKLVGPMLSPEVIPTKKTLRTDYDKRQFLSDGSTIPIYVAPPKELN